MDARVPRAQDAHERPAACKKQDVFSTTRTNMPWPGDARQFWTVINA